MKRRLRAVERMTSHEYRRHLQRLALGTLDAGPVLGVTPRQAARYAAGDTRVPAVLAKLLKLDKQKNLSAHEIRAL